MENYNIQKSNVKQYVDQFSKIAGKEYAAKMLLENTLPRMNQGPFLSIIMRTQGVRPQAFREVLLCLTAQTDTDFELLIMGHNMSEPAQKTVKEEIAALPDWMAAKTQLIPVTGGTRTTPLSKGFDSATGLYISILDDDDLVFDNWVEAFHKLYINHEGMILHSYSVSQDWRVVHTDSGDALASASAPDNVYCKDFNMVDQLSQNYCPTMSLAFPAYAYKLLGIHFDESLTTTEDWDFLMHTAFICGVCDTPEVTSIYRMWINSQNSQTLHKRQEWMNNYKQIQAQFLESRIILNAEDLRGKIQCVGSTRLLPEQIKHSEVFINTGSGFSANSKASIEAESIDGKWSLHTDLSDFSNICEIRFDPDNFAIVALSKINLEVFDLDSKPVQCKINLKKSNCVRYKDKLIFLCMDPQLIFDVEPRKAYSNAELQFCINRDLAVRSVVLAALKLSVIRIKKTIAGWISSHT